METTKYRLLSKGDEQWPELWNEINDPPDAVFVSGNAELLNKPAIAIVGTRKAGNLGCAVASKIASDLARMGWTIVSGLALGIDTAAHQGALSVSGNTVAIMATSIEETYPPRNLNLRQQIEQKGCIVSESVNTSVPYKYLFPKRNRLVAGLVQGVILIESPIKSGALITAELALDYNRELYVVPGPVDNPNWSGSHKLLKAGACLVENAEDVLHCLSGTQPIIQSALFSPAENMSASSKWIWDRLDLSGVNISDLQMTWAGEPSKFTEGLLALEMAKLVVRLPGAKLARKSWAG